MHGIKAVESIGSQFLRRNEELWAAKLGTTPELTINRVSLFNLLLSCSSSLENPNLDSIQKEFFGGIFKHFGPENC